MRTLALLLLCLAACASRRYTTLPEKPPRPHPFMELPRHFEQVNVPGREKPVQLSYVSEGHGPPLLLVHGLMTSAYSWRYVIEPLSKVYTVIAVDLPGAGLSDAPTDLAQTPQQLGEVLEAFSKQLNLSKVYVVGNSMGGYITLWWYLAHPERFERLMVMHSPGFPETRLYAMHLILQTPGAPSLLERLSRNHEQWALDNAHYYDESNRSREETREYSRWVAFDDRRECFRRALLETMDPYTMEQLPAQAAAHHEGMPPLKLLWARQDPLVSPAFGPRYQQLFPEAELVWVDKTSHFIQVDRPDLTVREILKFGEQ